MQKQKSILHQTKNGINLTDGLFIIQNLKTKQFNVISIDNKNDTASLFTITKRMRISDILTMESTKTLEVVGDLRIKMHDKE